MVTIIDVAKRAGVSIATVSNVINNTGKVAKLTEAKVRAAIRDLKYIPNYIAKSLKTSESRAIGVIVEEITSFNTPPIIDGICEYCEQQNYTVSLWDLRTYSKEEFDHMLLSSTLNALLAARVAGLIYVGATNRDVSDHPMPSVFPAVYAYCQPAEGEYSINYDDYSAALRATCHLIDQGHRKIGMICGNINQQFVHKRMIGFQTALMNHSLAFFPQYIKNADWGYETAIQRTTELLTLPDPPTAIFAMNDIMARGVITAANALGLQVPGDLSVMGFDDRDTAVLCEPALTTVGIPLHQIGFSAAEAVIALLEEPRGKNRQVLLPCELRIRCSVGPPKE